MAACTATDAGDSNSPRVASREKADSDSSDGNQEKRELKVSAAALSLGIPYNPFTFFIHEDANMKKLYTKEDAFPNHYMEKEYFGGHSFALHVPHVHKTLGILALLSFFYRYGVVYPEQGNLGFEGTALDWITMSVHALLALSSIIFRVPRKRIETKPMVIYEEYRQHAMVFTMRCFSVFAVNETWRAAYPDTTPPQYLIPIVVLAHHLLVDRISAVHGSGQTAVRSNSAKLKISSFYKRISYLYSFYQFLALASHLSPSARLSDMAYNAIVAIQSSAFLMTLYRKRIIRGRTHMLVYAFCLILSAYHILRVFPIGRTLLTAIAFTGRINWPRSLSTQADKYILWTAFLMVNYYLAEVGLF